jgi:hypothetical protein
MRPCGSRAGHDRRRQTGLEERARSVVAKDSPFGSQKTHDEKSRSQTVSPSREKPRVTRSILYCAIASAAAAIFAPPQRAEAAQPDCYEVAQRIVGAGLQLKRTDHSEMFDSMEFDDLLKSEVSVRCAKSGADVSLAYDGQAQPSPLWLAEAATVGSAATGAPKSEIAPPFGFASSGRWRRRARSAKRSRHASRSTAKPSPAMVEEGP